MHDFMGINYQLLRASSNGDDAALASCIAQGADVNVKEHGVLSMNRSALILAAQSGHAACAERLIKHGADIEALSDERMSSLGDGATSLMSACWGGHFDVVAILIKARVNLDVKSDTGWTALSAAISLLNPKPRTLTTSPTKLSEQQIRDTTRCVELVVQAGADVGCLKKDYPDAFLDWGRYQKVQELKDIAVTLKGKEACSPGL